MSHRTSYIAQVIFSFWSFEISEDISKKSETYYRSRFIFLPMFNIFGSIWIILVFVSTTLLKVAKFQ